MALSVLTALEPWMSEKGRKGILTVHLLCSRSRGFPGGSAVQNPPANAGDTGDMGSIPGLEDHGVGNGNPLQYSCLENPMDKAAW